MRRIASTTIAAVLASGAICALGQPANAADSAPLLRGKITTAKGSNKSGAKVHVFAEPSTSERLKAGQNISIKPIGTATTDSAGNYTVDYDASIDLSEYADSSGQLNLSVLVEAGDDGYTTLVQQDVSSASTGRVALAAAKPKLIKPAKKNIQLTKSTRLSLKKLSTTGMRTAQDATPQGAYDLKITVQKDYGGRNTVVGTWYSDMKDVTQTFTYSKSSKSTLGVAVSATGKAGSFSEGKTKTIATNASVGFGNQVGKGGWRYNTRFHYQKRHYKYCGGYVCWNEVKIEPVAWHGGATRSTAPSYAANHCVPMAKGTTWSITKTAAWTFAKGVDIGGMTVVSLSSKTGFSNAAKQTITYKAKGRLCGKNAKPGQTPKALRAKP